MPLRISLSDCVFAVNEAMANVPTYLLSLSAFLSIKLADFVVREANLIAFWHELLASILQSFSAKILDWSRYIIHKIVIILGAR